MRVTNITNMRIAIRLYLDHADPTVFSIMTMRHQGGTRARPGCCEPKVTRACVYVCVIHLFHDLRRHPAGSAHERFRDISPVAVPHQPAGNAEVGKFHPAVLSQQDITRLDIAVNLRTKSRKQRAQPPHRHKKKRGRKKKVGNAKTRRITNGKALT